MCEAMTDTWSYGHGEIEHTLLNSIWGDIITKKFTM